MRPVITIRNMENNHGFVGKKEIGRDGSVGTFNKAVSQVQPELIQHQKKIKILRHLFSAKVHQIV